MSRMHRALDKAEREGLLTWTQPHEERHRGATALQDPPAIVGPERPAPPPEPAEWEIPSPSDATLSPLFVVASDPQSPAAEQYRLLRTRLEGRGDGNRRRTQFLVVTSSRVGEGKTITSGNLALTMAREFQHEVVLIEADLRRPTLAALFGLRGEPGLVDVLRGTATLEEALVPVPGHHLFVLPAGAGATRSTELLSSTAMQRLLETLRARFDRIVVDTPPATLADTHVLARVADGVLVVVRAGVTPRPAVERTLAGLDPERLVGIVLNDVDERGVDYGDPTPPTFGDGA